MGWSFGSVVVMVSALAAAAPAHGQSATRFSDVMVLHNGDLHSGTVAEEFFTFETAYGDLQIPFGAMAKLFFGRTRDGIDRLTTVDGEHFRGRLVEDNLFVMRGVFGPSLDVATDDIDRIEFARHAQPPRPAFIPDVVQMCDGGVFRAQVRSAQFMVRPPAGLVLINRDDIAVMDLDRDPDAGTTRVNVQRRGALDPIRGTLMNDDILLRTQYGQDLTVAAGQICALRFGPAGQAVAANLAVRPAPPGPGDLSGGGDFDERPVQDVTIGYTFAIGIYPVTFADYDRFAEQCGRPPPEDSGWGRGRRPVVNVSWKDAVTYAQWLSAKTGHRYRLPSDAEWEYVTRAGSATRFWWGDEAGRNRANCATCGSLWDAQKTAPVGRFPPNPFGVYDLAGNSFEWTADCFHDTLSAFPSDGAALDKPGCGKRIIRGGAWSFPAREMRAANRWRDFPSRHSDDTGFRLVRDLP